jgi:hypothetical protein
MEMFRSLKNSREALLVVLEDPAVNVDSGGLGRALLGMQIGRKEYEESHREAK